jgi:DNA-binding NarL/FixJ family response regulator
MELCKLIIADDHPIIRSGIKQLIELNKGFHVIGEAGDGMDLLSLIQGNSVDIVIIDLQMPRMMGFEAIWEIKRRYPKTKFIILSGFLDEENIRNSLSAGANGIVSKASFAKELIKAIETVWKGGVYFSPDILTSNIVAYSSACLDKTVLSHREKQIVKLIAEGFTSKEIGTLIGISSRTVDKHRAHIMRKLQIDNIVALVRYAVAKGFVTFNT